MSDEEYTVACSICGWKGTKVCSHLYSCCTGELSPSSIQKEIDALRDELADLRRERDEWERRWRELDDLYEQRQQAVNEAGEESDALRDVIEVLRAKLKEAESKFTISKDVAIEAARQLAEAEKDTKQVKLRLGCVARVSSNHVSHACPQDDCFECWPNDIIDELLKYAALDAAIEKETT